MLMKGLDMGGLSEMRISEHSMGQLTDPSAESGLQLGDQMCRM
jgi:hypothetical protein